MSVIIGGSSDYCYYVNEGKTNDYILHLCVRSEQLSPRIKIERQYAFKREKGESFAQLRERIKAITHNFVFYGTWPDMKVYRTRKNLNLY